MQAIEIKIDKWKKRLLDLGKRNRLINFKETKRSNIVITSPNYDVLYKKLVQDEQVLRFPFPKKQPLMKTVRSKISPYKEAILKLIKL